MLHSTPTFIGVRQLHLDLSKISERTSKGEEFLVMKNSKPIFKIVPYRLKNKSGKYSLKDFLKLKTSTGDKNLSKNIDKILYQAEA